MEPGRLIIDENGINLPSIEDIYNSLLEEWSSMFPGKETLREDNRLSPQGQLLMSLAKQIDYKNREILFFINQFNTNTATGYFLDLIFNNFGIYRNKETKSYVTCNCVLEPGTTINIGDKIKNTNGDIFISTEKFTAPEPEPKTFDVEFEAENVGAIAVDANTINTIAEPVEGWNSVNNKEAGTVGTENTKSKVTCQCNIDSGITLPTGSKAKKADSDEVFISLQDIINPRENIIKAIVFVSEKTGPIPCKANTVNEILDEKEGWLSVNNDSDGTLGIFEESDDEFRIRAMNSHMINALGTNRAIYARLKELNGVNDVYIQDNRTKENIQIDGITITPNSTYIAISFDTTDETKNNIVKILHLTCAASTYVGDTEVDIPIENFPEQTDKIRFQTAIPKQIYIFVTIQTLPLYSETTNDIIKKTIIDNFYGRIENLNACRIGDLINANRFFENLASLQSLNQALIKEIYINDNPQNKQESVKIKVTEYPVLQYENIQIEKE